MPLHYQIDHAAQIVSTQVDDVITIRDIQEYRLTLVNDPEYLPGFAELHDWRSLPTLPFHFRDMLEIVTYERRLLTRRGTGPCAFVVTGQVNYGVMRIYEGLIQGTFEVGVFVDPDDALSFLRRAKPAANP